ncbi:hypothetical protein Leryth_027334 [Lithospermum erythrorhizon]|nr:hypothetical protein Leryth_027334 [Lithospermum erythrorhizon]
MKQSYTGRLLWTSLVSSTKVVNDHVEVENIGQSDSCSSPEGENFNRKWSCSLELADDYDIEIEVGKRLNQMISIPATKPSEAAVMLVLMELNFRIDKFGESYCFAVKELGIWNWSPNWVLKLGRSRDQVYY